jgi:hypothetical protein
VPALAVTLTFLQNALSTTLTQRPRVLSPQAWKIAVLQLPSPTTMSQIVGPMAWQPTGSMRPMLLVPLWVVAALMPTCRNQAQPNVQS